MIYDCIPFFNEIDILNLRLHILAPYVDRFVIEEATTTFSGQKKNLCFDQNKALFQPFLHKITYVVVNNDIAEQEPDATSRGELHASSGEELWQTAPTHARDVWQKNHLSFGLVPAEGYLRIDCTSHGIFCDRPDFAALPAATPDDILLFGDCDEIPNPDILKNLFQDLTKNPTQVFHLRQRNFYAFLNMEEQSGSLLSVTGDFPDIPRDRRQWLGTKVTTISQIPPEGIDRLRDLVPLSDPRSIRADQGGWHFGYMGGHHETNAARRIGVKVKAAAHQEYNDKEILAETMDHLYLGQDIFGRPAHFVRVPVDESYPSYLRNHISDYDYLLMPPITPWVRLKSRLDLSAGRFIRKAWRHITR